MARIRITVMRKTCYPDLSARYENPLETPCTMRVGDVFLTDGAPPEGFCESAWETLLPFVQTLLAGGGNFYNGWMKDEHAAMLSCNDGFRPVTFLLERIS